MACLPTQAWYSIDYHQADGNPFSEEFTTEYRFAHEGSGSPESLTRLMEMLAKYKKPQEQAELQLTIAMIYNQRAGLMNPAKAVEYFEKALVFDLPPTVLATVYLLRGNSYAALQNKECALEDYMKGLAVCLQFPLPVEMPDPPAVGAYDIDGHPDDPRLKQAQEEHRKQMEHHKQVMFEREMLITRYTLIDSAKHLSSGDTRKIRKAAEMVTKDARQIQALVMLATSSNKRPWK